MDPLKYKQLTEIKIVKETMDNIETTKNEIKNNTNKDQLEALNKKLDKYQTKLHKLVVAYHCMQIGPYESK